MSKLTVNVIIAGRKYPLSAKTTSEEEKLRLAAKKINDLILKYRKFQNKDTQDLLAMCALQIAFNSESNSYQKNQDTTRILKEINELNNLIDSHLQ